MRPRSLRIQALVSNRTFTLSPATYLACANQDRTPHAANQQFRHRLERAGAVPAALAPAIHLEYGPAIHRASAAHRDHAMAAAPRAADCPEGSPAAARSV